MCGIAGLVEFQPFPQLSDVIGRMTFSLAHRGPDGQGIQSRQDGPRQIAFGHTRLKIIDVSDAAAQPMLSDDGSISLIFNGEIYNYRELRGALQARGVSFRTVSDTEVILRLYEEEGEKAFEHLQGMFALGLWDNRKKTLLLARDPLGKKPLFYFHDRERFAFASEIKALLKHPQIRRAAGIRESAVPAFFFFGYVPSPDTLYTGIAKLPPGHLLRLEATGACSIRPFWKLKLPETVTGKPISEEAACRRLRELLREAVGKRLVSDVPLGAFLSGGLDSSIVVGLMSGLVREPVRTFSIGFSGDPHFDETSYARLAARHFGTRHEEFTVEPGSLDLVEKLVWHHDGPFADSSAIPAYLLSELTRRQVTVALNGDGGDELFAGYLRFPAALWLERLPAWSRTLLHRSLSGLPPLGSRRGPLRRLQKLASAAHLPLLQRYSLWVSVYGEDLGKLLQPAGRGSPADPLRLLDPILESSRGLSGLTRLLDMNLKSYLPEDLLVKTDRCTMAHGLEARSPFLDRELVEFAFSLPDRLKLRGTRTKFILRRAFEDLLPREILCRGKMGFGVPLEKWFRGDFQKDLRARLLDKGAALHRYVQHPALVRILDEHEHRRADHSHLLWTLLTFQIWLEQLPSWS